MAKGRSIWKEHADATGFAAAVLSGGLSGVWVASSSGSGLVDAGLWVGACLLAPFLSASFARKRAVAVGLVSVAVTAAVFEAARAYSALGPQARLALQPGRAEALAERLAGFAVEGAVLSAIGFALSLMVSVPMQNALDEQAASEHARRAAGAVE